MGFYAVNKLEDKIYFIEDWLKFNIQAEPFCPVCNERTEIKSKGSVYQKTHFAHIPGALCPTIASAQKHYELLSPTEKDDKNGMALIKWSKVNINQLYFKCQELLDGKLKFKEFKNILDAANAKKIWYYKGINSSFLPFVLLVNYGEFVKIKDFRQSNMYFYFDKSLYGDDLFLTKSVTHIWRITEDNLERIELINETNKQTISYYFWDYVKDFIES